MFRKLADDMYAAQQISTGDAAAAAAERITLIVNNRPDGGAPDRPAGPESEKAARDAGIG